MVNSANLIGELLGGLMNPQTTQRLQHALGSSGLGASGNPLSGILNQLQASAGPAQAGQPAAPGGGLMKMAMQALGGLQRSPAAAGGAGALAGMLLGGGKGAMRGGALALLGSLAASALSQSGRQAPPASRAQLPGSMRALEVDPAEDTALTQQADLILEAMVNAAKADGRIDEQELERIQGKMAEDGIDQAELEQLRRLVHAPMDLDGLAAKVQDPQTAAEVYAASALSITIDTDAERAYLQNLAQRTGLDDATVAQLHQLLGVRA